MTAAWCYHLVCQRILHALQPAFSQADSPRFDLDHSRHNPLLLYRVVCSQPGARSRPCAYRNTDPYCYTNTDSDDDPLPQSDPVRQCSACLWNTHVDSHTLSDTYANPDGDYHCDSITHPHSLSYTACLSYVYIPSATGTLNADSDGTTAGRECWHAIPVM